MKRTQFVLIILLMIFSKLLLAQATDLFISEYIEGSSNNKALEIFNGTGEEVDLSEYIIKHSTNGGGWKDTHYTFPVGATISNGDVWVIANENSENTILNQADEVLSSAALDYFAAFNGDDARGLFKVENREEVLIDVIGIPDEDPGAGWDVAGVSDATKDHTLIRKSSIASGNADWLSSAGTNEENSEWEIHDEDYFSDIGNHTFDFGEDTTPPALSNAIAFSLTSFQIFYSEEVTTGTAEDIGNYAVDNGLQILSAILQADEKTVEFETSTQTEDLLYTVTVNNVQDLAGNVIEPNSTITFTGYEEVTYDQIADIQANHELYEDQIVTVFGIVTIGVNQIQTGMTNAYMQDESGKGINIFDFDEITEIIRGNLIELTGTVTQYQETTEITDFAATFEVIDTDQEIPVIPMTIEEMQDYDTWEGTMISISGTLTEDPYYAGGGTNINIIDEEGYETTVRVWDTTGIDVSNLIKDTPITAQGVVDSYNGESQLVPGYQEDITIDIEIPVITEINNTPVNPFVDDEITITARIIDYDGTIDSTRLSYRLEYETDLSDTTLTYIGDHEYTATIPSVDTFTNEEMNYVVYVWAEDNDGNEIEDTKLITVTKHRPLVSNFIMLNTPEAGDTLNIQMNIVDSDGWVVEQKLLYLLDFSDIIYETDLLQNDTDTTLYAGSIPGQSSGVTVGIGVFAKDDSSLTTYEYDLGTYTYPVLIHTAILKVPAKPFNPYSGESIRIRFNSQDKDRAILRIYNAEGKLVFTPKNEFFNYFPDPETPPDDPYNWYYEWNGKNKYGKLLPLGLYICYLETIETGTGKKKSAKVPIVIGAPLK